jgi:hypothetical protein
VASVAGDAARRDDQSHRAWWLRALLVLQSPRPVFAALRDDSVGAREARQEPVTALVILAGIAGVLAAPKTGELLDEAEMDAVLLLVTVFLAGSLYGLVSYWLGAGALQLAVERFGSRGSYRRTRHLLAFAAAPLALSLVVLWPVRLAVYGGDTFRTGGRDDGIGGDIFVAVELLFVAWAFVLLVVGVRTVHGWSWSRAGAASVVAVLFAGVALGLLAALLSTGA